MILFRCNADATVGMGHLMRCRSLAIALRDQGQRCVIFGPSAEFQTAEDKLIFVEWIPQEAWESAIDDAALLVQLAKRLSANVAVLDDYRVDESYQLVLRNSGLSWVQFEGRVQQPLWADAIINTSPGAQASEYTSILRSDAKLLFGPRYALLRPEFLSVVPRRRCRPVKQVLVTFGGGDDRGANLFVIKALLSRTSPDLRFLIISGAANPQNPEIAKWVENWGVGRVTLKINPPQIAALIASCDLAIMAGGTTVYEVACCNVQMILISIADNQCNHSIAWEKTGKARYLGAFGDVDQFTLLNAFNLENKSKGDSVQNDDFDARIVDGLGAARIAKHLVLLRSDPNISAR